MAALFQFKTLLNILFDLFLISHMCMFVQCTQRAVVQTFIWKRRTVMINSAVNSVAAPPLNSNSTL